jgi:hypothetical protein
MSEAYSSTGTLSNKRIVTLDKPVPLPPGRVRVTVEPLPNEQPDANWTERLRLIQDTLRDSGYRFRTRAEIDAQIQDEREGWES